LIDTAMPRNTATVDTGHESLTAEDAQAIGYDSETMAEMSDQELRELSQLEVPEPADTENPWA
jgi:hypothetical protein